MSVRVICPGSQITLLESFEKAYTQTKDSLCFLLNYRLSPYRVQEMTSLRLVISISKQNEMFICWSLYVVMEIKIIISLSEKICRLLPFSINKGRSPAERGSRIHTAQLKTGASVYRCCVKSTKARGLKFCMLQNKDMEYIWLNFWVKWQFISRKCPLVTPWRHLSHCSGTTSTYIGVVKPTCGVYKED